MNSPGITEQVHYPYDKEHVHNLKKKAVNYIVLICAVAIITLVLSGNTETAELVYKWAKILGIWCAGHLLVDAIMFLMNTIYYIFAIEDSPRLPPRTQQDSNYRPQQRHMPMYVNGRGQSYRNANLYNTNSNHNQNGNQYRRGQEQRCYFPIQNNNTNTAYWNTQYSEPPRGTGTNRYGIFGDQIGNGETFFSQNQYNVRNHDPAEPKRMTRFGLLEEDKVQEVKSSNQNYIRNPQSFVQQREQDPRRRINRFAAYQGPTSL